MKTTKYKCIYNNQESIEELDAYLIPGYVIKINDQKLLVTKRVFDISEGMYTLYLTENK